MSDIEELSFSAREVLYNYNKNKLRTFMESRENLILLEHFLSLAKQMFTTDIIRPKFETPEEQYLSHMHVLAEKKREVKEQLKKIMNQPPAFIESLHSLTTDNILTYLGKM